MRLGDYCNIKMGQAPRGEFYNNNGQGFPLLAGAGDLGEIYPNPSRFSSSAPRICSAGEIILCIRATIGKKNWADRSYCLGRGVASITPINSEEVFSNYIWHWLTANEKNLLNKGKGATFLQISKKDIEDTPCFLPSISEQRRIAAILDKADAIRRKRQQSLKQIDEFVKSQFIEMFGDPVTNPMGWEVVTLDSVCTQIKDGEHASVKRVDSGVLFISARNILADCTLRLSPSTYISEDDYKKISKRFFPEAGDILLTCAGTIGNVVIVPEMEPFSADRGVAILKPDYNAIASKFLLHFLLSEYAKNQMAQNTHATALSHLYVNKIKEISIYAPPITLQNQFAAFVEQADKSKFTMQRQLSEIEILSSALKQKFFA